ncbi:MAG: hypothetical protein HUK03_00610 [Bacteroidaceae bacterium]|nr:hypothetical protein [Bacteroidaceae bacterium]
MKKVRDVLLLCLIIMGATSCASILTKRNKDVTFKGIPHTELYYSNSKIGEIGESGFATVSMRKKGGKVNVTAKLDGYEDYTVKVPKKLAGISILNILNYFLGFGIDALTGKLMTFKDEVVDVTVKSAINQGQSGTEVTPDVVSRENAGETNMERAIVRWNIESDPAGARIFWRVISSVPDEVRNTNETYLSTTPYEETRSFNIIGLTYENARDVTIEIRLKRKGYNDQTKRFNVRQALDQREISTFFELVPQN